MRKLRFLDLSYCNMNSGCLQLVARNFPNLETLALSYCSGVTVAALELLAPLAGSLRSLDITWCKQVSKADLPLLQSLLPKCTIKADLMSALTFSFNPR
jgi:hypothetical protein